MVYRRKAKKKQPKLVLGVPEPVRRSMFDVVNYNFEHANRNTYVCRIIYLGEHVFADKELLEVMQAIVSDINNGYCDEKLTGLFLYYKRHFCHLLEGSEDMIHKHFQILISNPANMEKFGNMKMLSFLHHISQRISDEWYTHTGVPPKLLEPLDPNAPMSDCRVHVYSAIHKIKVLTLAIAKANFREKEKQRRKEMGEEAEESESEEEEEGEDEVPELEMAAGGLSRSVHDMTFSMRSQSQPEQSRSQKRSLFLPTDTPLDPFRDLLPEVEKIDFAVKTIYLTDIKYIISLYSDRLFTADYYRDITWPVEIDFIPHDVFDKPRMLVPTLPEGATTGHKAETEQDEGMESPSTLSVLD